MKTARKELKDIGPAEGTPLPNTSTSNANSLTSPSKTMLREAVQEANSPNRLVSEAPKRSAVGTRFFAHSAGIS
jgi:hypothetical protein